MSLTPELTIDIIALSALIIFLAHTVKGATGFANALIAIPLLSLFLDVRFVVPVFLLFDLPSSGMIAWRNRSQIHWRTVVLILPFLMVGTLVGAYLLVSLASGVLKRVFGIVILLFAARLIVRGRHFGPGLRHPRKLGVLSGLAGGFTGGMFGMDGPVIVMYLSTLLRKTPFRATLTTIFLCGALWRGGIYVSTGLLGTGEVMFALVMIPVVWAGIFLGSHFQEGIGQRTFDQLIGGILVLTGILLVWG